MKAELYADGACKGNPGRGGYGYIVICNDEVYEGGGRTDDTTNNRMELTALIEGLNFIKDKFGNNVEIVANLDSQYTINGSNSWLHNWQKNNWKTSAKKDVLNKDLWIKVAAHLKDSKIIFNYVKAHNGHLFNERADYIASNNAEHLSVLYFNGDITKYHEFLKNN